MRKLRPFVLLALGLSGCAGKATWENAAREVYVETLPTDARIFRDGAPSGHSPVGVPIPTTMGEAASAGGGQTRVQLRAEREGYQPTTLQLDPHALPARVVLVMAPVFGEGETPPAPPSVDDAEGLYLVGSALQRNDRCDESIEFLQRVVALAPRVGKTYRELGLCMFKLGDKQRAAQFWEKYLLTDPDAKDAAEFQGRVDRLRSGRTIDDADTTSRMKEP